MKLFSLERGQGSLEYLIIIAVILAVSGIVVLYATGAFSSNQGQVNLNACRQAAAECKIVKQTVPNDPCSRCLTACKDTATGKEIFKNATDFCKLGLANLRDGLDIEKPTVGTISPVSAPAGTVSFSVTATDNPNPGGSGIASCNFYWGTQSTAIPLKGGMTQSGGNIFFTSFSASAGTFYAFASCSDRDGNTANSSGAPQTITITPGGGGGGDTIPPIVSLTQPSCSVKCPAVVSGVTTIEATASDNVGVSRVEFYINNGKIGEDAGSPYQYGWDTTTGIDACYSLNARAYDAASNVGISTTQSVFVRNGPVCTSNADCSGGQQCCGTGGLPPVLCGGNSINYCSSNCPA